jgi:hypothetical protein
VWSAGDVQAAIASSSVQSPTEVSAEKHEEIARQIDLLEHGTHGELLESGGLLWCEVPTVWPYHPSSAKGEAFGGDYWRATHEGLTALFDKCERLACWYDPADPQRGDNPRSGFMATYVGQKK